MDKISVYKEKEHYLLCLNKKFYCSCDSNELKITINEIIKKEKLNCLQTDVVML